MSKLITREYQGKVFHFREDGYFNMTEALRLAADLAEKNKKLKTENRVRHDELKCGKNQNPA